MLYNMRQVDNSEHNKEQNTGSKVLKTCITPYGGLKNCFANTNAIELRIISQNRNILVCLLMNSQRKAKYWYIHTFTDISMISIIFRHYVAQNTHNAQESNIPSNPAKDYCRYHIPQLIE